MSWFEKKRKKETRRAGRNEGATRVKPPAPRPSAPCRRSSLGVSAHQHHGARFFGWQFPVFPHTAFVLVLSEAVLVIVIERLARRQRLLCSPSATRQRVSNSELRSAISEFLGGSFRVFHVSALPPRASASLTTDPCQLTPAFWVAVSLFSTFTTHSFLWPRGEKHHSPRRSVHLYSTPV